MIQKKPEIGPEYSIWTLGKKDTTSKYNREAASLLNNMWQQ